MFCTPCYEYLVLLYFWPLLMYSVLDVASTILGSKSWYVGGMPSVQSARELVLIIAWLAFFISFIWNLAKVGPKSFVNEGTTVFKGRWFSLRKHPHPRLRKNYIFFSHKLPMHIDLLTSLADHRLRLQSQSRWAQALEEKRDYREEVGCGGCAK